MLEFNEGALEDDLLFKLQSSFMDRFSLEQNRATEIAMEVLDMLSLSDSNLKRLTQYYFS